MSTSAQAERIRQTIEQSVASAIRTLTLRWDSDEQQCYDEIMQAIAPFVDGKDTERIDWLERTKRALATVREDGGINFDAQHHDGAWFCVNADGLREAIDAGMKAESLDAAMAGRSGK